MKILAYVGATLSLLVLGAHFYRDGEWPVTILCVGLLALLACRRPWSIRVLQVALALGALEWLWTTYVLVQDRIALGRPWGRLAALLGAVALLTAGSAAALERLRRR